MRVALIGPLPPPSGGMANQTLQLQRLLQEEGVTVELVQVNAPYRPQWMGRVRGLRAVARLLPYLVTLWRALGRADVAHLMANSGWSWHLFAAPAIWIGRLRGTPVVVNYRGGFAGDFLARQAGWVRFSLRHAARLIVPSGFLRAVFAEHGVTADIVPNIVDTGRFNPGSEAADAPPAILVARNLEPIYDNASAIRALALVKERVPSAQLVVAGSGPEEARLKQLAESLNLGDSVRFTGRVEAADMPALYRRARVALNPSLVDNMPNSVLEALAAGVPVVSTRVGGVPYIVEHEKNALLVEAGAVTEMAEAIIRILTEPALAERLRTTGLATAQIYTWPKIKPKLLKVYEEAMDHQGPAALLNRGSGT
jgi:glycosyltransferase involved in cell wall biosynthesis